MNAYFHSLMGVLVIMWAACAGGFAAESKSDSPVSVSLVSEFDSIRPGEPFWVGVRIVLEPGWHTYWKNPGDAGMPPRVDWRLPEGFEAVEEPLPRPHRFESDGIVGFGYEREVVFPVLIRPPAELSPGVKIQIGAKVGILICSDVCVPAGGDVRLDLTVSESPGARTAAAALLDEARKQVPVAASDWRVRARLEGRSVQLLVAPPGPDVAFPNRATFFPETKNLFVYDQPAEWIREGDEYRLVLPVSPAAAGVPLKLAGVLTAEGGWGAGSAAALAVDVRIER